MNKIDNVKYIVFPKYNTGILSLIEQEQLSNLLLKIDVGTEEQFLVVSYKEPFAEELLKQAVIMKYGKHVKLSLWGKFKLWRKNK